MAAFGKREEGGIRSSLGELQRDQKARWVRSARVMRSRLCGRAPVRDQSVIGKIKETLVNGAKRHMYIFAASDSEREREREKARENKREGGRDFEGVTRQEAIFGAFD